MGHPFGFIADANALLPLMHFIEGASVLKELETWLPGQGFEPACLPLGTGALALSYPGINHVSKHGGRARVRTWDIRPVKAALYH